MYEGKVVDLALISQFTVNYVQAEMFHLLSVKLFGGWFSSGFFLVQHWFPKNLWAFGLWFTEFIPKNFLLKNLNIPLFSLSFTTLKSSLFRDYFYKNWPHNSYFTEEEMCTQINYLIHPRSQHCSVAGSKHKPAYPSVLMEHWLHPGQCAHW